MNYRNVLLIIFCLAGQTIFAQSNFGVQLGYQNSNYRYIMNFSDLQPTAAIGAYRFGVFYSTTIGQGMTIQPEVSYAQGGFRLDKKLEGGEQIMTDVNLNAVESSLIFRWGSESNSGKMAPFFDLGPKFSYAISRKATQHAPIDENTFQADMISPLNIGFVIGGGFSLPFGQTNVKMFVRYEMGLNNSYNGGIDNTTLRSQNFSFGTSVPLVVKGGNRKTYNHKLSCI